jgi:hypothetical protein
VLELCAVQERLRAIERKLDAVVAIEGKLDAVVAKMDAAAKTAVAAAPRPALMTLLSAWMTESIYSVVFFLLSW